MRKTSIIIFGLALFVCPQGLAQAVVNSQILAADTLPKMAQERGESRTLSGVVVSQQNELVPGVTVIARYRSGEQRTTSDEEGNFRLVVPNELVTLTFEGNNVSSSQRTINPGDAIENLRIKIVLVASPIDESVVIVGTALEPSVERRDDTVYKNTLFARDDQILFTLNAGINAGQHEGGGKSLEVRRFGFNLDHGGLNGGLKILVDDVQQNQSTQGHGQGYLGQLKSLSPELVEGVEIINGPFSAQYGDFSGLGVVQTVVDANGDGFDDDDPTDQPRLIGDEIQQHDSRLQQGVNVQYLHPFKLLGQQALLNTGGKILASQINVGLSRSLERQPLSTVTQAQANVTNLGGYIQQSLALLQGHVRVEGGLRFDYFRFRADGFNVSRVAGGFDPAFGGTKVTSRFQPKLGISYTPADEIPVTVYFNYGRGIASQDARGVVGGFISDEQGSTGSSAPNSPGISSGPPVSTTDFYQIGTSHNTRRFSLSTDLFLIDQSNQQVYIADDGSIEFAGPSRTYGGELKFSVALMRHLSVNGGITRVGNSFFRGTNPRIYVDSAPHTVGNGSITLTNLRGFNGSLRYRYISNYRLDGEDASIRASGHDVVDLSVSRRVKGWIELNLNIDNLLNKRYFETQNFYESRSRLGDPLHSRIHGTPGYSIGVTGGVTFRFGEKQRR